MRGLEEAVAEVEWSIDASFWGTFDNYSPWASGKTVKGKALGVRVCQTPQEQDRIVAQIKKHKLSAAMTVRRSTRRFYVDGLHVTIYVVVIREKLPKGG